MKFVDFAAFEAFMNRQLTFFLLFFHIILLPCGGKLTAAAMIQPCSCFAAAADNAVAGAGADPEADTAADGV